MYDPDYQIGKDIVILLSKYSQEKMEILLKERGFLIVVLAFLCSEDGMDFNEKRCRRDLEKAPRWMKIFAELKYKALHCLYDMLPMEIRI